LSYDRSGPRAIWGFFCSPPNCFSQSLVSPKERLQSFFFFGKASVRLNSPPLPPVFSHPFFPSFKQRVHHPCRPLNRLHARGNLAKSSQFFPVSHLCDFVEVFFRLVPCFGNPKNAGFPPPLHFPGTWRWDQQPFGSEGTYSLPSHLPPPFFLKRNG